MAKMYAYYFDKNRYGIVKTWEECKLITQYTNARYKGFDNVKEADEWLSSGAKYSEQEAVSNSVILEKAVYFDAGTGRGRGVEVRITDEKKNSLINLLMNDSFNDFLKRKSWKINEFGNIELGENKTNNYGELLGLFLALECAKILKLDKVLGDSQLVINYWSKGQYNESKLNEETISLITKVTEKRKILENQGMKIIHISGDINPADLGFHK